MNDEPRQGETPPSTQPSEVAASLEAGLVALKQKSYDEAIAHLEAIAQSSPDRSAVLKAQMALVKAYGAKGDLSAAIARCQSLSHHSSLKVRQWAAEMLPDLLQRQARQGSDPARPPASTSTHPPSGLPPEDITGFVPHPSDSLPAQADASGFTPLTTDATSDPVVNSPPAGGADITGFVPLSSVPDRPSGDDNPFQLPSPFSAPDPAVSSTDGEDTALEQGSVTQMQPPEEEIPPPSSAPQPLDEITAAFLSNTTVGVQFASADPQATPPPVSYPTWNYAGRAQKWPSLGAVDRSTLWGVEALTAIAPVVVLWGVVVIGMALFNLVILRLFWLVNLTNLTMYGNPLWMILLGVAVCYGVTPWLLEYLLTAEYGAKPLSLDLLSRYSAESARLIRRLSNQHRCPLPTLQLLPTAAPVVMTYGNLRRNARLVISQGVLEGLREDEMAALIATQMAHLHYWDFTVLSGITLLLQLPYQLYWAVASWGDRQDNALLQGVAVGLSSLAYGLYWMLRWSGLWLSRLRHFYSDRLASEWTGNPNGLTRALVKLTLGLANDIQRQRSTAPFLEGFELLMPIGHRTALTLGSVSQQAPLEPLLDWGRRNPYRRWLSINQAHSPLGDRLQHLMTYARRWRLSPELELTPPPRSAIAALRRRQEYWLQIAPFAGLLGGIALALAFWIVGAVGDRLFQATNLSWVWGDWSLLRGCALVGLSMGLFVRINRFYPDINPQNTQVDPALVEGLTDAYALPIDSQSVRMQGTLLGRRGLSNMLCQDLILHCTSGLIRLHVVSPLGVPGNLIPQGAHPQAAIGQRVTVTGWLHCGATPWVDVETLRPQGGRLLKSSHPLWMTFLATATALAGLMIILRGV